MSLPVLFTISFTVSGETRRCSCYRFGSSIIVVIIILLCGIHWWPCKCYST